MAKMIKRYEDLSFGVIDRKYLACSKKVFDIYLRDHALEDAHNVWATSSGSLINRPGTKLVKDFGDNAIIKCFTFARGQNQQYLLVFSQGRQEIFYIDNDGFLVEARQDEVEQSLVPNNLASNSDQGFNISSTAAKTTAYQIFGSQGIEDTDVYTVDITFPVAISLFRVVMDAGMCAKLQGTFYKSTGESWTATASTPSQTYTRRSCGGSSCRTTAQIGSQNLGQYTFEFPSGAYQYNDIKRVVLTAKRYTSYTSGNFPQNYTTGWQLTNGYLRKLTFYGTVSSGDGAVWTNDIPVDKIAQASYDFTNRYLFFAQKDIPPYVVSVFGAFTFTQLNPSFPQDYNFTTMGYPDVVCCGQSRLWLAGFDREPTSILGSSVGYNLTDLQNFTPTMANGIVLASSAVKFQPTDIRNKISWAIAANALNFASWDGVFKMTYGNDQPISATGAVVIKQNEEASSRIMPAWYNGMMCFASMGRDELRLMDYNLQRERQYSVNISEFSNDLNSRKIKKIVFKKDNNSNIFVLYEDGTAAQVRVINEKAAGFFPFSVLDGIQDILMGKGDNGDRIYLVVSNGNRTQLLMMDEIDYPKMPAIDYDDLTHSMQNVSDWLEQKAPIDAKQYVRNKIEFNPVFMASQIQTENPSSVNNLIATYPKWVMLGNPPYGENSWAAYVNTRLFFKDERSGLKFSIDIYSMPKTDGTGGNFIFGVPTDPDAAYWEQSIETSGGYIWAVSAWDGLIGITSITFSYPAKEFAIFTDERYVGIHCASGCENASMTKTFDEPVAEVCYGVPYEIDFTVGYIMNDQAYARRHISTIAINTANSWGLQVGTATGTFQEAYYAMLLGLPYTQANIQTLVDMYQTDTNIYGVAPVPMKPYIQMKLEDRWSEYKAIVFKQTIPYPFEIFSFEITLEENNSDRGK